MSLHGRMLMLVRSVSSFPPPPPSRVWRCLHKALSEAVDRKRAFSSPSLSLRSWWITAAAAAPFFRKGSELQECKIGRPTDRPRPAWTRMEPGADSVSSLRSRTALPLGLEIWPCSAFLRSFCQGGELNLDRGRSGMGGGCNLHLRRKILKVNQKRSVLCSGGSKKIDLWLSLLLTEKKLLPLFLRKGPSLTSIGRREKVSRPRAPVLPLFHLLGCG